MVSDAHPLLCCWEKNYYFLLKKGFKFLKSPFLLRINSKYTKNNFNQKNVFFYILRNRPKNKLFYQKMQVTIKQINTNFDFWFIFNFYFVWEFVWVSLTVYNFWLILEREYRRVNLRVVFLFIERKILFL